MYPALTVDAWQENWLLYDKVDFNGVERIIYVHPEVTQLDIREDVYTSWVDWAAIHDNLKFRPALRTTGMDPIGGGKYTGDVYFLINGWKLYVDFSKVQITGVLFSDDYPSAYFTPDGIQQFPVTVAALVNTVAVESSVPVPTPQQNAAAVVEALPDTFPISTTDKEDVAHRVWNQSSETIYDPGSFGEFFKMWFASKLLTVAKFLALK